MNNVTVILMRTMAVYIFACTVKIILYTHRQTRGARGPVETWWTNRTLILNTKETKLSDEENE